MSKAKVAIVTDSTCNLPEDLVAQYNIHVIPQIINWEGHSLRDQVDITTSTFYDKLVSTKEHPTTSQPSPGQFHEFFSEVADQADSIVGIFLSEKLSGTLASAHAGAAMLDDYPMEIVDTRSVSLGLGLIALAAARAAEAGKSYQEVAEVARTLSPRLRVLFVVDTLEYLHKGGRIGGANRLVGSMLSIKPVLHLEDGAIETLAKIRTKPKAVEYMVETVIGEMEGMSGLHAGVIHSTSPDEAQALMDRICSRVTPTEILMNELSPVIGVHTGPGMLGMGYYVEP